eukprot:1161354-Pelagomonas_calceolata.AAC.4
MFEVPSFPGSECNWHHPTRQRSRGEEVAITDRWAADPSGLVFPRRKPQSLASESPPCALDHGAIKFFLTGSAWQRLCLLALSSLRSRDLHSHAYASQPSCSYFVMCLISEGRWALCALCVIVHTLLDKADNLLEQIAIGAEELEVITLNSVCMQEGCPWFPLALFICSLCLSTQVEVRGQGLLAPADSQYSLFAMRPVVTTQSHNYKQAQAFT